MVRPTIICYIIVYATLKLFHLEHNIDTKNHYMKYFEQKPVFFFKQPDNFKTKNQPVFQNTYKMSPLFFLQ